MNASFIDDLYRHVEDMTGLTIAAIRQGTSPADWNLTAVLGRAEGAAEKIERINPASPVGRRYATLHTIAVTQAVDRWIAETLGDKGFGPA